MSFPRVSDGILLIFPVQSESRWGFSVGIVGVLDALPPIKERQLREARVCDPSLLRLHPQRIVILYVTDEFGSVFTKYDGPGRLGSVSLCCLRE
jgi:hypothetical protein